MIQHTNQNHSYFIIYDLIYLDEKYFEIVEFYKELSQNWNTLIFKIKRDCLEKMFIMILLLQYDLKRMIIVSVEQRKKTSFLDLINLRN